MGRKPIEITQPEFEKLCNLQCTLEEIAGFFQCSPDTIERWCKRTYEDNFANIYKKHSQNGKISLRRWQFRMAENNVTMAIWLGKQYLGQAEKIDTNAKINTDNNFELMQQYLKEIKYGKECKTEEEA